MVPSEFWFQARSELVGRGPCSEPAEQVAHMLGEHTNRGPFPDVGSGGVDDHRTRRVRRSLRRRVSACPRGTSELSEHRLTKAATGSRACSRRWQFSELRQPVIEGVPGRLAGHMDVSSRSRARVCVEYAGGDEHKGNFIAFHGRSTAAAHAKRYREAQGIGGTVVSHQLAPCAPLELARRVKRIAAMRGAPPAPAARTMALISRPSSA